MRERPLALRDRGGWSFRQAFWSGLVLGVAIGYGSLAADGWAELGRRFDAKPAETIGYIIGSVFFMPLVQCLIVAVQNGVVALIAKNKQRSVADTFD